MNVLLTGSKGFIGSNILRTLEKSVPEVSIFCFEEKEIIGSNWLYFLEVKVKASDCIFHVGAVSSTKAQDIQKTMYLNYEFSKILFDLAAKHDKPVIYSSSAALYGNGDDVPRTLYAWTKKAAEDYGLLKVKNFVSLRYFNVYGPGENHKGDMASVAMQAYIHHRILSAPFPLLPGHPTRDFVYVKDVVHANIVAAGLLQLGKNLHGTYDVGTGYSSSFEFVLQELNIPFSYLGEDKIPEWYQHVTCANPSKFLPGWRPAWSLSSGLSDYKKYLQSLELAVTRTLL